MLCGSVYLILATNLGARLGILVALAGSSGWIMLMGLIWMIYGIGLKGPEPSWVAVPGRTVLQDTGALFQASVLQTQADVPAGATPEDEAQIVRDQFIAEGWAPLPEEDPSFGQAAASAGVFLEESGAFAAGQFTPVAVYDIGGERWPLINESLDFLAFRHDPHFVVVEVAPLVETRTEPGRDPTPAVIDETRQRQYVYMVRDLGAQRQPALFVMLGSGIVFFALCWLLHRRERILTRNRSVSPVPVTRRSMSERMSFGERTVSELSASRHDVMSQYLPVIVLVVLAVLFGVITFAASRLLAPRRPSSAKTAPYESGIVPSREPPERFPVGFYVVAMLFIMFDIEIIFLYPYAVSRASSARTDSWRSSSSRRCSSSRSCTRWRRRPRLGSVGTLAQPRRRRPRGHTAADDGDDDPARRHRGTAGT